MIFISNNEDLLGVHYSQGTLQLEGGHKLLLLLGQTAEGTSYALLLDSPHVGVKGGI